MVSESSSQPSTYAQDNRVGTSGSRGVLLAMMHLRGERDSSRAWTGGVHGQPSLIYGSGVGSFGPVASRLGGLFMSDPNPPFGDWYLTIVMLSSSHATLSS